MESLAKTSLAQIFPLTTGAVVHDNSCGTGAGFTAVVDVISGSKAEVSAKGTEINEKALEVYKGRAMDNTWPVEVVEMDNQKLPFTDITFSYSIGNALLFVLPNNGINTLKETDRALKLGGTMVVSSWAHIPNMEPLKTATKVTRTPRTPPPRQGLKKWSAAESVQDVVEKGGFGKDKITLTNAEVYCSTPELTHFATMLWSFIGGMSEAGWLKCDEENWEKAIDVIIKKLNKTEGFKTLDRGKVQLKFMANVATATK